MPHKDFVTLHEWSQAEIQDLLELSAKIKANRDDYRQSLAGKSLGLYFEKSSTRTRISFEVGIYELGSKRACGLRGLASEGSRNVMSCAAKSRLITGSRSRILRTVRSNAISSSDAPTSIRRARASASISVNIALTASRSRSSNRIT